MLSLGNSYAAATNEAERATLRAAGEAMLAVFHGTAFWIGYLLGSISGLILSVVILQSGIFSRSTAYTRIASSVLDFGLFIPTVGLYISLFAVLFLLVFNVLISRQLFQLATNSE
jgi:hypothetical protein